MTGARLIWCWPSSLLESWFATEPVVSAFVTLKLLNHFYMIWCMWVLSGTTMTCSHDFAVYYIFANVLLEDNEQVRLAQGLRSHLTAGLFMYKVLSRFKGQTLQVEADVAHCLENQAETPTKDMPPVTQNKHVAMLPVVNLPCHAISQQQISGKLQC